VASEHSTGQKGHCRAVFGVGGNDWGMGLSKKVTFKHFLIT
jgi:hypothetical protein